MTFKKFALTLALGLGCAGMAAMSASGNETAPAAPGNEGKPKQAIIPTTDTQPQRDGLSDTCRNANWPYIPAECMRSAAPQRPARAVRIIPIYTMASRS